MTRNERKMRYLLWTGAQIEEMEEQFNKDAKEGWRFAADAVRITDENAGTEDREHTSGGVLATEDKHG